MRRMQSRRLMFFISLLSGVGLSPLAANPLEDAFLAPPSESRPLTWWHWLNGTITKQGITLDLESMKRAGLGGCYLFNCGGRMPEGDVRFMRPEWLAMMDHTLREAERLGLKFGVHNCDGFSQSGGPWITPETSMKELTWTATDAEGPAPFDAVLAEPARKEGFYRPIATVAFPLPEGGPLTGATLRGSIAADELGKLSDGDPKTFASFAASADEHRIEFCFAEPRTVRSLSVQNFSPHRWEEDFPMRLEVSSDGQTFRPMGEFTANWDFQEGGEATAAFAEASGTVFRISFKNPVPVRIGEIRLSDAVKVHFAEAKAGRLRSRGHGAEARHHAAYPGPDRNRIVPARLIVARESVVDLTSRMAADGRLKWDAPAGKWRILRIGYTSNGHYVAPATEEGRGLECDKLDPKIIRFHLDQYVGKLIERAGTAAGKTFSAVEIDSWECGIQNWTSGLERRFRDRLGYDLMPFMPAMLEGWIVGGADVTERALWDWRRFLADQFSESYFSQAQRYLQQKGVTYVGESTGRQQYLYDVAYGRNSDVTMGEFWIDTGPGQGVRVDNKVASSIAHVAGKTVVAAEAYTASPGAARWQNHPFSLKAEGDRAFCAGVNQFVFHTFAHQPYPAVGPGFTFFFWGLNFNRGNTWWNAADAWMTYLARCNHMLRQGRSVSDVLWFVGEDVPNRIAWRDELRPALPRGYDFDGCDAGAVMDASVKDGRIVLPGGTRYRLLLLPSLRTMRPAMAEKIRGLAEAGAIVVWPVRPTQSPSLRDIGEGDDVVRRATMSLFGDANTGAIDRNVGRGRMLSGLDFEQIFSRLQLPPDFECRTSRADAEVLYVHREIGALDAYFISNQQNRAEDIQAIFRVAGRLPEFWDPDTGTISHPGMYNAEGPGRMRVPIRLEPNGSIFVVFREGLSGRHAVAVEGTQSPSDLAPRPESPPMEVARDKNGKLFLRCWDAASGTIRLDDGNRVAIKGDPAPECLTIEGPWSVSFPPHLGAPPRATFARLISWPEHEDVGIRHFSGTAAYEKDIELPASCFSEDRELYLDLGEVAVIARARLNGRDLPVLWKPPFRARIDGIARPGQNSLEIRVTNLWPNRLIGDASLPNDIEWQPAGKGTSLPKRWPDWLLNGGPRPSGRIAFCTRKDVYSKEEPLLPSGLIGPVRVRIAVRHAIE